VDRESWIVDRDVASVERLKPNSRGIICSLKYPSLMKSGTMKTCGAVIAAKTCFTCGSCFQNASRTSAKIPRRRNSTACCFTGNAEFSFSAVP